MNRFAAIAIALLLQTACAGYSPTITSTRPQSSGNLLDAAESGDLEAVRKALDSGANINTRGFFGRGTPLVIAARKGHRDVAALLIERGADINAQGKQGWTALIEAAYAGNVEMTHLLLAHGADMNVRDVEGNTALTWAKGTMHRNEEVVRMLRGDELIADRREYFYLDAGDLPAGFRIVNESRPDNRAAAAQWAMLAGAADGWLQQFVNWGRVNGYRRVFAGGGQRRGERVEVTSEVDLFLSETGARQAFQAFREALGSAETARRYWQGQTLAFHEARPSTIGIESLLIHTKTTPERRGAMADMIRLLWIRGRHGGERDMDGDWRRGV